MVKLSLVYHPTILTTKKALGRNKSGNGILSKRKIDWKHAIKPAKPESVLMLNNCENMAYFLMISSLILLRLLRVHILKELFFSISVNSSLRTADVFPVVVSLPPENNVCEPERQNDFRDLT